MLQVELRSRDRVAPLGEFAGMKNRGLQLLLGLLRCIASAGWHRRFRRPARAPSSLSESHDSPQDSP
jgi:hypothetical protein